MNTLISILIALVAALIVLVSAVVVVGGVIGMGLVFCAYLGFISNGNSWRHGLATVLGVPSGYLLLKAAGYIVSVEGHPLLHYAAYLVLISAPYTVSLGLALVLLDGLPRAFGRSGALEGNETRFWTIVLTGTLLGYLVFADDIWREIVRVDCSTLTFDARESYPECRKM